MKSFGKFLTGAALVVSTFTISNAALQAYGGGGKMGEKLKTELGLSDAQAQKISEIRKNYIEQFKKNKDAASKGDRSEMKAVREKMQAEIAAVLTPEQKTKFTQLMAERKAKMKEHRGDKKSRHSQQ